MNEQLAAIKARRAAITPGVWWVDKLEWQCVVSAPNRVIASTHPYSTVHDDEPNAAFIAAAPADIDTLLAMVDALTAEVLICHGLLESLAPGGGVSLAVGLNGAPNGSAND